MNLRDIKYGSKKPWKVVTVNTKYGQIKHVEREYKHKWAAELYVTFVENCGGGYHPSFFRRVEFSEQEPK